MKDTYLQIHNCYLKVIEFLNKYNIPLPNKAKLYDAVIDDDYGFIVLKWYEYHTTANWEIEAFIKLNGDVSVDVRDKHAHWKHQNYLSVLKFNFKIL